MNLTPSIIENLYRNNIDALKRINKYKGDCYRNLTSISKLMSIFIEKDKDFLTKSEITERIGSAPSMYSQHSRILTNFNLTENENHSDGLALNEKGRKLKKLYMDDFGIDYSDNKLSEKIKEIYALDYLPFYTKKYCVENLFNIKISELNLLKNTIILWLCFYSLNPKGILWPSDVDSKINKNEFNIFDSEIFELNISTLKWFDAYLLNLDLIVGITGQKKTLSVLGYEVLNKILQDNTISEEDEQEEVDEDFICLEKETHQKIIYGAPGTGKSYLLAKEIEEQFKDFEIEVDNNGIRSTIKSLERVTFYDGYTYGQFVGSYKPVPYEEGDSNKADITYEYVPGPLSRIILNSYLYPKKCFVLVIEEINRARADRVFGNIFQLLDRDSYKKSQYPVSLSEEQYVFFKKNLPEKIYKKTIGKYGGLYFPSNLYIWCTMNSADQGVYPMDSAFKRRWNFKYIGLDDNMENFGERKNSYFIQLENEEKIEWNILRTTLNEVLLAERITEDRLIAPFFIKPEDFDKKITDTDFLINDDIYESKILMYLFEDILRHKKKEKIFNSDLISFSKLIAAYREKSNIFSQTFTEKLREEITKKSKEEMKKAL